MKENERVWIKLDKSMIPEDSSHGGKTVSTEEFAIVIAYYHMEKFMRESGYREKYIELMLGTDMQALDDALQNDQDISSFIEPILNSDIPIYWDPKKNRGSLS